jgi:glutamine synthetase
LPETNSSANIRFDIVRDAHLTEPREFEWPTDENGQELPISQFFGINTFGLPELQQKLPAETFRRLTESEVGRLDKETADAIANVVKEWALSRGVTHFAHWFQPMTGSTAEKHDSFLTLEKGVALEKFSGEMLVQGEPDASSLPSGGMRTTFEARGYTAWDLSSPMFLMEGSGRKTLCIPSAFVSYTGQCLDEKTPLLRSVKSLEDQAMNLLNRLGEDKGVDGIRPTVGAEQEYFLVDRGFFHARPDLVMSGRTLMGSEPARGQQLEDHYFGSIPLRVSAFMREVEFELYKMGVPAKTRHNEVAPSQFELAPVFVDANVGADHNQIIMETLKRVGTRHGFKVLLHEKPFDGLNGSGKHVNWSVATSAGENLLDPGETPADHLRFLSFLASVLWGVHKHEKLIRSSIASPGNDFRLGANEAPPAIISVFLGETLTRIVDAIENGKVPGKKLEETLIELGVEQVPVISRHNTDRNRTSPFAFTGNKFEFRAVGGSQSISLPITAIQTAVTAGIKELNDRLEKKGLKEASAQNKDAWIEVLREMYKDSKPIRFEGDNYSDEWVKEAEKRGLSHLRNTPQALGALIHEDSQKVLTGLGVLSEEELKARYSVKIERYNKQLHIEGRTLLSLVDTMVLPSLRKEQHGQLVSYKALESVDGLKSTRQKKELQKNTERIENLLERREQLEKSIEKAESMEDIEQAKFFAENVSQEMASLRQLCDEVEDSIDDALWPLPKYREMLFIR